MGEAGRRQVRESIGRRLRRQREGDREVEAVARQGNYHERERAEGIGSLALASADGPAPLSEADLPCARPPLENRERIERRSRAFLDTERRGDEQELVAIQSSRLFDGSFEVEVVE